MPSWVLFTLSWGGDGFGDPPPPKCELMLLCLSQTSVLVCDPHHYGNSFIFCRGSSFGESGLNGKALGEPEVLCPSFSPRWSQTPMPLSQPGGPW